MVWVCRREDNLQGPVLPFQHVNPGDGSQVSRLGGRSFYLLKHLITLNNFPLY